MAYSQNNEEEIILCSLKKFGLDKGRFLDLGAYDGITFSNTMRLVELGWSGVCVEPSPYAFVKLLETHKNSQNITLVQAAVSADGRWLEFYDSHGDAVSSADPEHVAYWTKRGVNFSALVLKSVAIVEFFEQFGTNYNFINLDVESLNLELFKAFPWTRLGQVQVVCAEHDNRADEMEAVAAAFGFCKVGQTRENLILERNHA